MRACLVLVLLIVPMLAAPLSSADQSLVRMLLGNTVIADGTYTFRDYLVVPAGATLTIRNATVWLDADRLCTGRTNLPGAYRCQPQLEVHGALVVESSTLDTRNWQDDVDHGFILDVERGTARIANSTLRHYVGVSFVQAGPAPTVVEGNAFREGVGAIRFMQGVDAVFRRNLVDGVRDGVLVSDAATPIEDNVFLNVTRSFDAAGYNWAIAVTSASPNDHAWRADGPVRRNLVDNATAGIVTRTGSANVIEDNVVRNVQAGMLLGVVQDGAALARDTPIVRRNLVEHAREGVRISGHATTGPSADSFEALSLEDNALVDITCIGVRVTPLPDGVSLAVDARAVWWGDGRGPRDASPECPAVLVEDPAATVDASPWLRAPPQWAADLLGDIRGSGRAGP